MTTLRRLTTRLSKRGTGDSGQALVEFAVCMTVFLALTFGIMDFARAVNTLAVMTNLTSEGSSALLPRYQSDGHGHGSGGGFAAAEHGWIGLRVGDVGLQQWRRAKELDHDQRPG